MLEGEETKEEVGPFTSAELDSQTEGVGTEGLSSSIGETDTTIQTGGEPAPIDRDEEEEQYEPPTDITQVPGKAMETRTTKKKRRRITSYLSDISRQVERNDKHLNKLMAAIQSIQKQRPKSPVNTRAEKLNIQPTLKQISSQVNQLQKQVARIQIDITKIKIQRQATKAKIKGLSSTVRRGRLQQKSKTRKNKSDKRTKVKKGRRKNR